MSFLAGTRNLISGSVQCSCGHMCWHWDEVPGPSQGWRIAGSLHFVGVYILLDRRTEEQKSLLNAQMFVQASLTCICSFNAMHLWCDEYLLYFCKEEQKKWVFTVVATASFLAGTRNLVSGSVQCSCGHMCCHVDEFPGPSQGWRIAGSVYFVGVYILLDRRTKEQKTELILESSHKWICSTFFNQCYAPMVLCLRLIFEG